MFFQTLSFHQPMRPILTHMCKHKHTCTNIYISVDKQLDSVQICIRSTHIYTHTLGRDKDTLSHTHTCAHTHTHTHTHICMHEGTHMQPCTHATTGVFFCFCFLPPFVFWYKHQHQFPKQTTKQLSNGKSLCRDNGEGCEPGLLQPPSSTSSLRLVFFFLFFVIDSFLEIIYQEPSVHNNHKWFPVPFFFCVISQQGNKGTKTYYSLSLHHVQRLLRKSICHLSRNQHEKQMKNRLWLKSGWNKIHHRPEETGKKKSSFIRYQTSRLTAAFEKNTGICSYFEKRHRLVHGTSHAGPQSSTWPCSPTVIPHRGMKIKRSFWISLGHQYLPDMFIYSKSSEKPLCCSNPPVLFASSTMHSSINPFLHHFWSLSMAGAAGWGRVFTFISAPSSRRWGLGDRAGCDSGNGGGPALAFSPLPPSSSTTTASSSSSASTTSTTSSTTTTTTSTSSSTSSSSSSTAIASAAPCILPLSPVCIILSVSLPLPLWNENAQDD